MSVTPRVAICYFGLTRSTRYVYKTHDTYLFDVLKAAGIDYTVFLHTWNTKHPTVWNSDDQPPVNETEHLYLKPTYSRRDDEDEFLEGLTFSNYFDQAMWERTGDGRAPGHEWYPQMVKNHLCMMQSIKRVTQLVLDSGEQYDFVLYIRPDIALFKPFPVDAFGRITPTGIAVLNFKFHEGYNPNVVVVPFANCSPVGFRYDEAASYRRLHGRLVTEKYLKYIIHKYYTESPVLLDFPIEIVRPPPSA